MKRGLEFCYPKGATLSIEYRAGRRYYYRVERVNGKLKKTYVGGGITGEVAAREMQQKAALRQQEIAERNEFNNQLWSLKRIHRLADTIAREAYYAAHLLAVTNRLAVTSGAKSRLGKFQRRDPK